MREISRLDLAIPRARTLVWHDGVLVNVANGWTSYPLDGAKPTSRYSGYGHGFDAAVMAPGADTVALVASAGTKALLLEPGGRVIRELNRSFYYADAYRYPLALFTLPDGRTGLVHCPEEYNQLEIDVARTGERLTKGQERPTGHLPFPPGCLNRWPAPAQRRMDMQPFDTVEIYDLPLALEQPRAL